MRIENLWYTDLVTIYRVQNYSVDGLLKQRRAIVRSGVPCRVMRSSKPRLHTTNNNAFYEAKDILACANNISIKPGDELLVTRGGRIGHTSAEPDRYIAGSATYYYEPYAGAVPGLDHQEVPLGGPEQSTSSLGG